MVTIKGFRFIDGTKEGFSVDNISDYDNRTVYFIRTDPEGEHGYVYINGNKYLTTKKNR